MLIMAGRNLQGNEKSERDRDRYDGDYSDGN